MLNPQSDRLEYAELMLPNEGYKVDFAVGTTYTLDLEALVGVCLSLGLSCETDSTLMNNPICMLEALRSMGDRIAIYCEGGRIKDVKNANDPLYILLERMVNQVPPPKKGNRFYTFHPKLWLVRYVSGDRIRYRIAVLSRNLTFDSSWDVCFAMNGDVGVEQTDKNNPVCDFLRYLKKYTADTRKRKKISQMINELKKTVFRTDAQEFNDYCFYPIGIGDNSFKDNAFFSLTKSYTYSKVFVMSPFVSKSVCEYFNRCCRNTDNIFITRAESLRELGTPDVLSNFKVYAIKDALVGADDKGEDPFDNRDIHAKIYVTRYSPGSRNYLYLGSLNATDSALDGNVEFMLCLQSTNRHKILDRITDDLLGNEDYLCPFRLMDDGGFYEQVQEKENTDRKLDKALKKLVCMQMKATVTNRKDGYKVDLSFKEFNRFNTEEGINIEISPFLVSCGKAMAEKVSFERLKAEELSCFYRLTLSYGNKSLKCVVSIATEGMPENREQKVISSVISDTESFYRYISFLLGEDALGGAIDLQGVRQDGVGKGNGRVLWNVPSLYEKMLATALKAPDKLGEIDRLCAAVENDGVIPYEFAEMYNKFKGAVKKRENRRV